MLECLPMRQSHTTVSCQKFVGDQVRQTSRISWWRGTGIVEFSLVLSAIVVILWGAHALHNSMVRNYPGPRSALQHASFNVPPILAIAITPDQNSAISVGIEGVMRSYDLQSRQTSAEVINLYPESSALGISPDGSRYVVGTGAGCLELWTENDHHAPSHSCQLHDGRITRIVFLPDGQSFMSCGTDQRNMLWDANTLTLLYELPQSESTIHCANFLPQGNLLVTGNQSGQIQLWDLTTRQIINSITIADATHFHESIVKGIAVISDETEVLAITRGGQIGVWNLRNGQRTAKFQAPERLLASLCLLKDKRRAITGGTDGQIQIWDVATGRCTKSIPAHAGTILGLDATADGRLLISAGWDGATKFWDI